MESPSDTLQNTKFNAREVVSTQGLQHASLVTGQNMNMVQYVWLVIFARDLFLHFS